MRCWANRPNTWMHSAGVHRCTKALAPQGSSTHGPTTTAVLHSYAGAGAVHAITSPPRRRSKPRIFHKRFSIRGRGVSDRELGTQSFQPPGAAGHERSNSHRLADRRRARGRRRPIPLLEAAVVRVIDRGAAVHCGQVWRSVVDRLFDRAHGPSGATRSSTTVVLLRLRPWTRPRGAARSP